MASADRVVIQAAAAGIFWTVEIDLDGGTATARGPSAKRGSEPQTIDAETLISLREHAARASAGGDLDHREQFPDGEVSVAITLAGRTVTLRYVTAGWGNHPRIEALFTFACTCL